MGTEFQYREAISPGEMNSLRASVGFRQIDPRQLEAGLRGSAGIAAVYAGETAAGMSRLIWDGGGVALITDVLVRPEYRGLGLEQELIERLLGFLRGQLRPGFGIQVDVRAFSGQAGLYEAMGFQVSTIERRGTPMHICLTDRIELTDARFGPCGHGGA